MPAHNEQDYLRPAVIEVVRGLRTRTRPFELIISENGSTDRTIEVAEELAREYDEVTVLSLPSADYGRALRAGFLAATGELVANFDVDYVDLGFLDQAIGLMDADRGPAAVVASKRSPGAHDTRPVGRRLVTAVFALILRVGFRIGVSDTHGMKVMVRAPFVPIVEASRFGTDLFDTELILRAERAGLVVAELPVTVRDTRPPRSSIVKRIPRSLAGLVRLRVALWRERR
ncbi:MAG TPA: glycosyltransferase [Acidimicrobiales bacterium]|nr:glycosyltransferase [Acidimicrobiales bacterium]